MTIEYIKKYNKNFFFKQWSIQNEKGITPLINKSLTFLNNSFELIFIKFNNTVVKE